MFAFFLPAFLAEPDERSAIDRARGGGSHRVSCATNDADQESMANPSFILDEAERETKRPRWFAGQCLYHPTDTRCRIFRFGLRAISKILTRPVVSQRLKGNGMIGLNPRKPEFIGKFYAGERNRCDGVIFFWAKVNRHDMQIAKPKKAYI